MNVVEQGTSMRNCAQSSLSKKILHLDSFGEPIRFKYSNGCEVYSTGLGACLSLFVTLITFTYFGNNLHVMFNRKGSTISAYVVDSAFTYNDTIT